MPVPDSLEGFILVSLYLPRSNKCNFMQKVVKKMLISKEKYFYFLKDHLYVILF